MTTALFTVLFIGQLMNTGKSNSKSPWCMWKWATFLHQMTWEWNFIISLIFWTMLYPFEDHIYSSRLSHWLEFMDHICPLGYVTIDWLLNAIKYEKTPIGLNLVVVGVYGIVNITYTKVTGSPVYPPFITWDSPLSWTIGFALLPLFAAVFYLEYWLTLLKMRRIYDKREKALEEEMNDSTTLLQHQSS